MIKIKMIAAESFICQTMVLDFLCSLKAGENVSPGILIKKSITYLVLNEENERIKKSNNNKNGKNQTNWEETYVSSYYCIA